MGGLTSPRQKSGQITCARLIGKLFNLQAQDMKPGYRKISGLFLRAQSRLMAETKFVRHSV